MEVTPSPLGRYSEFGAFLTAIVLVIAAVSAHLGIVMVDPAGYAWLDASAGVAIGVLLGQRQTTNGAGRIADKAHRRIDELEAQLIARRVVSSAPPPTSTVEGLSGQGG